ncbi:CPBP family intramembrane glutamic endopeptidase [Nocardioides sp.]|uniref:CPBP family intramembrane glutamic endopeptidase n=1 Tax=Nocardioides sp. TaxID=35761 RepID=UPI0037835FF5
MVLPLNRLRALAAVEVALAAVVVLLDLAIPSVVLVVLAAVSLAVRQDRPSSLGFHRLRRPWRTTGVVVVLTVAWTLLEVGLVMPLLEHATGSQQDMSAFADLEGDVGMLVVLLVASWTLAAVVEETAFRGYLLTRVTEVVGTGTVAVVTGVAVSSALFGLIHTEQGLVGVLLSGFDAVYFAVLRLRAGSVWAAVLAHGTSNTIGIVAVFLVGPVTGLW